MTVGSPQTSAKLSALNKDIWQDGGIGRAVADSIILQPNFSGIGFDFNKLINYFTNK